MLWQAVLLAMMPPAPPDGPGYSIATQSFARPVRIRAAEDRVLWIRSGAGLLDRHDIAAGDIVRFERGATYNLVPRGGKLEFIEIRIKPLAPGRPVPPGIRPAPGRMGTVVSKAEIDKTIAATEANAPLHSQDNFTMNFVLFKGRTGPWEAHANCVDIYLVQTGEGIIELGGTIVNAKQDTSGEPRGTAIAGASKRPVVAGDLLVIPRNQPHHMNPVRQPLAYVLIKVWSE